jgi:hypothetical protein
MGGAGMNIAMVVAMLVGGVVAAPITALIVQSIPARLLGVAVAALLLVTQTHELLRAGTLPGAPVVSYGVVAVAVCMAALRPRLQGVRPVG